VYDSGVIDLGSRADKAEMMDDLTQPDADFAEAYRELEIINGRLGGVRAIDRFLPRQKNLLVLDIGAGACDIGEALLQRRQARIVSLDLNPRGLKLARKSIPLVGDALQLPFRDGTFDVVMASLFFHHLSNEACVAVLRQMWRIARSRVLVNDLHRHRVAYLSIRLLSRLFGHSRMVRHDGPVSVLRAFKPRELLAIAAQAGIPARVHRSFPYRLVMVAEK